MVLVKRKIVHQPLPDPLTENIKALGVEVCLDGRPLKIYSIYRPPAGKVVTADLQRLLPRDADTAIVAAGDWNCKHGTWNSYTTNHHGTKLLGYTSSHGYDVSGPETPTHYPDSATKLPDVIDLAVHKGLPAPPLLEVLLDELHSDHQPVLMIIKSHPAALKPPPPRPGIDWTSFMELVQSTVQSVPVTSPTEVDAATAALTATIQAAIDEATLPPRKNRLPKTPARLARLLAEKRRLRKTWQRTRDPAVKTKLNAKCEEVRSEIAEDCSRIWENRIADASDDWASLHKICRQLRDQRPPIRPLTHRDGHPRYRAEDRAEIFAESLERQFRPNPDKDPVHTQEVEAFVRDYLERPDAEEDGVMFFSPGQVQRAIQSAKPRKAPGPDNITNAVLKHLPPKAVAATTRLFNGILRSGHFPTAWKTGRVIMIPKQGKNILRPESYRPITLLSCLSKLFERLLLQHLMTFITPRPEQYGFRSEHSTTLQLTRVLHHLTVAFNKKEHAIAVFLDMEKAFDRVWHSGLLFKLATSPTPRRLVKVIASFLKDRNFVVNVEGSESSIRPILAGVPQGSCLSPVCYSRYTDDIPNIGDTLLALYADDAAYITTSFHLPHAALKMQRVLDELPPWLSKWRLSVNVGKTQAVAISRKIELPQKLVLQEQEIAWSRTAKYLGVTIDRKLNMEQHLKMVRGSTIAARAILKPVLQSNLPLRMKLGLYYAYIRPRLTYAAPAWYALLAERHRVKLRSQQSLCLSTITGAERYFTVRTQRHHPAGPQDREPGPPHQPPCEADVRPNGSRHVLAPAGTGPNLRADTGQQGPPPRAGPGQRPGGGHRRGGGRRSRPQFMGGVDRLDANIGTYRIAIRGKKWYTSILTWLVDVTVNNSALLARSMGANVDTLEFRRSIARTLLLKYGNNKTRPGHPVKVMTNVPLAVRRHAANHMNMVIQNRKRCAVCKNKR